MTKTEYNNLIERLKVLQKNVQDHPEVVAHFTRTQGFTEEEVSETLAAVNRIVAEA